MEGFEKVHAYFRRIGDRVVTTREIGLAVGLSNSTVLEYANTLYRDGVLERSVGERGEYLYQSKELTLF